MFEHKNWKVYAPNTDVVGGGGTESVIQPKTRFEYFLDKIAKALGGGEGGTGGGSFVIRVNEIAMGDGGTKLELDKTWQEISDAIEAGMYCCIVGYDRVNEDDDEMTPVQRVVAGTNIDDRDGSFGLLDVGGSRMEFIAATKDGYPYYTKSHIVPATGEIVDNGGCN